MTASPLFSVIIATYGRPSLLPEAVDSVHRQTVADLELIIVDDASPEPASIPPDSRIRLLRRTRNGGAAAAWNTALAEARGRYLAFLGDDDVYLPTRLESALEGHAVAPIVVCWSRYIEDRTRPGRLLSGNVHDTILDSTAPSLGATSVVRGLALPFDERFRAVQDLDWWLRVSARANVATVPRVGYLVRRHDGPRHGNDLRARIDCSLLLMEVHAEYFQAHPRAAAFRWKRIGLMAEALGDHRLARRAFSRAVTHRAEPRAAWHLARSLVRSGFHPQTPAAVP